MSILVSIRHTEAKMTLLILVAFLVLAKTLSKKVSILQWMNEWIGFILVKACRVFKKEVFIFNHRLQTIVFEIFGSNLKFMILTLDNLITFCKICNFQTKTWYFSLMKKVELKRIFFALLPIWSHILTVCLSSFSFN